MKVYLVYCRIAYEGANVHGVFSTREKAEAALKEVQQYEPTYDGYHISETELDVPNRWWEGREELFRVSTKR